MPLIRICTNFKILFVQWVKKFIFLDFFVKNAHNLNEHTFSDGESESVPILKFFCTVGQKIDFFIFCQFFVPLFVCYFFELVFLGHIKSDWADFWICYSSNKT